MRLRSPPPDWLSSSGGGSNLRRSNAERRSHSSQFPLKQTNKHTNVNHSRGTPAHRRKLTPCPEGRRLSKVRIKQRLSFGRFEFHLLTLFRRTCSWLAQRLMMKCKWTLTRSFVSIKSTCLNKTWAFYVLER